MLTRTLRSKKPTSSASWKLQDAKARFSEVVRRACTEGPQRVTVHGKDAVVIVAASDYVGASTAGDKRTGADLIPVMQKGRRLGLRLKPTKIYLNARPPIDFSDEGA
jgi:prevent-host-death family protein